MKPAITHTSAARRIAIAVLAVAIAGGASLATARDDGNDRGRPDGPPSPERMLERMQQELNLTDAQAAQVKQVLQQERTKHEAAHKEAMQALSKVLDKEQLQKLEAHMKRGPRGEGGPGRGPRDGGEDGDARDAMPPR